MAGIVTDLPVHHSSEEEIHSLVNITKTLLVKLLKDFHQRPPRIITVARSTEDEYTPANQVELIQDSVTMAMKHVYHQQGNAYVDVKYQYLKYSRRWVYETPSEICDCTYL